ncbi:MAG: ABC transporter ATP-binding protein/permease [Clostridiales bacterium]|jgi:ATP-binding cassette subfamily B protein|nr:ABC transporter ATP-binding protein/permease [Clostridiales bacterium]
MSEKNTFGQAAQKDTNQGTSFVGGYGKTVATVISVLDKPVEFKKTFARLVKSLSLYKYALLAAAVFAIASSVFVVFAPKYMAALTDMIIEGVKGLVYGGANLLDAEVKEKIYGVLIAVFVFYVLSAFFLYIQSFIMATVAQKVSLKMRSDINKKLSRLPVGYFDKHSHGDIMSRVTNDVDAIGNTLNQGLTQIVTAVFTILGMAVMMFTMNVPLTLVVLLILPFSYVVIRIIAKRSQKHFREQQNYLGAVNGCIEEIYGGHDVVRAFGMEAGSGEKFRELNDKLHGTAWKSQTFSGMINPLVVFIGNLAYVAVVVFGAYLTIKDPTGTTLGIMYAFVQYVKSFTSPINQTAQISNVVQSTVAAAERIFVFLSEEEEKPSENPEKVPADDGITGRVTFENLTFGYEPGVPVLKNLSLDITPGSRVAIVGQTGSGKTTLVKLLMRFYTADSGRILIDGGDIKNYDGCEYRRLVAMVLQDIWLFHGTIRENIRYGRLGASDREVEEAAAAAGADKFISALKDGYDTVISEDAGNLSEGQKQLLSIARAVIRRSAIIIFDEATSSIDTLTERVVQDAVDKITKGKTCFVIAHRLSTIINSDLILVMQEGELKERGTHKELLAMNGIYAKMYNTQFAKS